MKKVNQMNKQTNLSDVKKDAYKTLCIGIVFVIINASSISSSKSKLPRPKTKHKRRIRSLGWSSRPKDFGSLICTNSKVTIKKKSREK